MNRFIVFKSVMKYQEKIFFIRQNVYSNLNAQGADLISVVNNSKYMFQQILVKKNFIK